MVPTIRKRICSEEKVDRYKGDSRKMWRNLKELAGHGNSGFMDWSKIDFKNKANIIQENMKCILKLFF